MFAAVNGRTLGADVLKNIISVRSQVSLMEGSMDSLCDLPSLGAVGCAMSHIELWKRAVNENLRGMYVFESDATCLSNLDAFVEDFATTGGDALFFGLITFDAIGRDSRNATNGAAKKGVQKINKHFSETHAYFVTQDGAKKLLEHAHPIETQVDVYMSMLNLLGLINVYACCPSVCNQQREISTIQTRVAHNNFVYGALFLLFVVVIVVLLAIIAAKCAKKM
jgi:GR25 family glycosyltransferase involved in LPS biosynthesis